MQPDTIIPGAGNPQAWNLFSYVSNNPIKATDPSGHKECNQRDESGKCVADNKFIEIRKPTSRKSIYQVDISTFKARKQYEMIFGDSIGYNACGPVSASSSGATAQAIIEKAGTNYDPDSGIQPTKLAEAVRNANSSNNIIASENINTDQLYSLLSENQVVIDLLVAPDANGNYIPSDSGATTAHFARILGIDMSKEEIILENTLPGSNTWTVSFIDYYKLTYNPEQRAVKPYTKVPKSELSMQYEHVVSWGLIIPLQ